MLMRFRITVARQTNRCNKQIHTGAKPLTICPRHPQSHVRNGTISAASCFPTRSSIASPAPLHRTFAGVALSDREKAISRLLQSIIHPRLKEDLIFSGHVRSINERDGQVSIVLPLDDEYRELKKRISEVVTSKELDWLNSVRVVMETSAPSSPVAKSASPSAASAPAKKDGLSNVKHIIAVSSCKGGVGKSTVAVNLAYALSRLPTAEGKRDCRVGILDADVYGPSLPTMVSPRETRLRITHDTKRIIPPVYEGVKLMSYGFVSSTQRAPEKTGPGEREGTVPTGAFIRGPLASAAIRQMSLDTEWGELDYLIVDFPPGTGDIQLTLTQHVKLSGAVVVSTPQKLALVDVQKGLEFFRKTNVPVLAIVQNMAYFLCGTCDTKHRLFGQTGEELFQQLKQEYAVQGSVVEIPLLTQLSESGDRGDPFVLATAFESTATSPQQKDPSRPVREAYDTLAKSVQTAVEHGGASARTSAPSVKYDDASGCIVMTEASSSTTSSPTATPQSISIPARTLRLACQCAGCVDEITGASKLVASRIPPDVRPKGMQSRGNYAFAVHWSDGHASSIYPFEMVRKLAGNTNVSSIGSQ